MSRKSAQSRALREKEEYILPVRFDDTEIPGLRATIAYIDTRFTTPEELVGLILQKIQRPLKQSESITSPVDIPRNAEERRQLLTRRRADWEYYLFAGVLAEAKDALEPKWRDHQLRYVRKAGPVLRNADALEFTIQARLELVKLSENLDRVLRSQVKTREQVYGTSEVPSDPVRIEYLAKRVIEVYENLLDWSARIRGVLTSSDLEHAFELLASYADNPIEQTRAFIDQYVDEVRRMSERLNDPDRLADPNREPLHIMIPVTWELDERVSSEFEREMGRLDEHGLLE